MKKKENNSTGRHNHGAVTPPLLFLPIATTLSHKKKTEKGKPSKKRGRTGSDRGRKKIPEKKNNHSCHRASSPPPQHTT